MLRCKGILVIEKSMPDKLKSFTWRIDRADVEFGYCGKKIILNRKKLNKIANLTGTGNISTHLFSEIQPDNMAARSNISKKGFINQMV